MNVNCILWLFILVCDVVKSDNMNLLYISVVTEEQGKQLGSAETRCSCEPYSISTYILLKWQM